MQYEEFASIYQRALTRVGGERSLEQKLPKTATLSQLEQIQDHQWLSAFSQKVFQSGISWQVVRNKWPHFEDVFYHFDIEKMTLMPNEMWEEKAKDTRIIRHLGKVLTIRDNASMIYACQQQHKSFAHFVAHWPTDNIIGLWSYLKKEGKRLGGNTGPYTLRVMGKDTFLMTKDVEGYLRQHGIIHTGRDTQSAHNAAQAAFNHWQQESGKSLAHISQIIALSVN